MTLIHIHTDRDIAARLIDDDRRTWIDVIEVTSQPIFRVRNGPHITSYEAHGDDTVCAVEVPQHGFTALFYPSMTIGNFTGGLRFTFDSERPAMEFRLTHADHILDVEPANAARSVLMSLESA